MSYNLLFVISHMWFGYIQKLNYCKRCSSFAPSWLGGTNLLAWKKWTPFLQNVNVQKGVFILWFNNFLKSVAGCLSWKDVNSIRNLLNLLFSFTFSIFVIYLLNSDAFHLVTEYHNDVHMKWLKKTVREGWSGYENMHIWNGPL